MKDHEDTKSTKAGFITKTGKGRKHEEIKDPSNQTQEGVFFI
jgi:hypothetical protein